jgi:L-rhamnose mutarotase
MAAELRSAGAQNYSIFLRGNDLFGYLEVADFAEFRGYMDGSAVNARWQSEMAGLIDPLTDPATGFHQRVDEVFHLD